MNIGNIVYPTKKVHTIVNSGKPNIYVKMTEEEKETFLNAVMELYGSKIEVIEEPEREMVLVTAKR